MREVFGNRLQLDSAIETNAASSAIQKVDGLGNPRLRHEGTKVPTNDESLFLARTAFRGPLELTVKRSDKVRQGLQEVADGGENYDKYLTTEVARACLEALDVSRAARLTLVPDPEPLQPGHEVMPHAV